MKDVPSAQQFKALAMTAERYKTMCSKSVYSIAESVEEDHLTEADIEQLVQRVLAAYKEAHDASFDEDSRAALDWLDEQPSFCMALDAFGFTRIEAHEINQYWQLRFESVVRRWASNQRGSRWGLSFAVVRASNQFLSYISGVAEACHGYLSKLRARAAIDGPETVDRMKAVLSEFEQLLDSEWLSDDYKARLSRFVCIPKARACLNEREVFANPTSRRNDIDLPARLMASELIRLHQRLFSATHKRVVFNLMGLPFIDRPLEMRTIERLASAEKSRPRQK
jgi:hypothetical protein